MPRKTLEVIYAEWIAHRPDDGPEHFDQKAYAKALVEAGNLPDDTLADFVWEKAEELATCTNGGWEAYVCPFGCGPHTVPFSAPQAENELEAAQVS
jgi:hypothetical protein